MRIGFDAKRAVQNFTGLGNYSRYLIEILYRFYPILDSITCLPHVLRFPASLPKDYGKSAALLGAPSASPVAWRKITSLFITVLVMSFHSISGKQLTPEA